MSQAALPSQRLVRWRKKRVHVQRPSPHRLPRQPGHGETVPVCK
jgi:hypothetical protein